jgi:signal transduction histidine kinase
VSEPHKQAAYLNNITPIHHNAGHLINSILPFLSDAAILTTGEGKIIYYNKAAKALLTEIPDNVKDIGYRFNFDVGILENISDVAGYSPLSVVFEGSINLIVEVTFEASPDTSKHLTIRSSFLEDTGYLIIFSENKDPIITATYEDLSEANQQLLEKIEENEQLRAQAQSQAIRESLVNRISNAIRTSLEIETILQTAVEEIAKALRADNVCLCKFTQGEKELSVSQEYTIAGQQNLLHNKIDISKDFYLQEVLETHKPTTGTHTDSYSIQKSPKYKLIVPVIHHEELFGILLLLRQSRNWHTEEINLVQSVADQISISIKNAQLYEETTSKNVKISVLNEILKSINASLILDDVFYTIGKEINRLIDFDRASIAILDDDSESVRLFARIKKSGEVDILRSGPLLTGGTAISWAIENLKPIMLDLSVESDFTDTITLRKSGIKTAIIIPMINKGKVSGIFYVGTRKDNIYSEADIEIMTQIAGQVAIAVENARLYWQTQTQALIETLINQIVNSIRKSLKLKDVLSTTVKELAMALSVTNCIFCYYLEPDTNKSFYEHVNKNGIPLIEPFKVLFHSTIKDNIKDLEELQLIKSTDFHPDKKIRDFIEAYNIKSLMLYPLISRDPLSNQDIQLGLLAIAQTNIEKDWQPEDISLVKVLSNQINVTINQSRLFEQTQKQKTELEVALQKLKEAQAQLVQSEKMASLGQLVAGVAHEINTPIGSIASNNSIYNRCVEKLKTSLSAEPPDLKKAEKLLEMLEETTRINNLATERIKDIVKSLKNFARLDESNLKTVDIHEGIESTIKLIRHELKDRVNVTTEYGQLPDVECYPNLLNQVFMNLIINAYQSIEGKGTITITTKYNEGNIYISINDTGSGISKTNMKKLFDPGFTTKGVGVGTGLGLSICYQIVDKHKGQILVNSKEGVGSTFTIVIPAKQH